MKELGADFREGVREALVAQLHARPMVFTAHQQMQEKADMAYPFTQEASFLYLTGINEPDWMVLFDAKQWHLVRPEVSDVHALFDGTLPDDEARAVSGINSIVSAEEAKNLLIHLSDSHSAVATIGADPHQKHYDFSLNPAQKRLRTFLRRHFSEVMDCRTELSRLRAIKQGEELVRQRSAIDTTVDAFKAVKEKLPTMRHEYEIEAYFNSAFRIKGAEGHAYAPIVAGGKNACTLHYGKNQAELPRNGLVLMDIGAQTFGYAADITRTYAIGSPTERHIAVHAAVEKAHHKIIDLIKPELSFKAYSESVDEIMKDALESLGLLQDRTDTEAYRTYFPHAISHGLGLDVHESLGGYKEFQPGMVFTVEPGIYIPEEEIGVRIEDNILVTETGHKNLSAHLPTGL